MVFITLSLLQGFVTVINKMIILQAKKALGTANGTLINYLEASLISLLLAIILGNHLSDFAYLSSVPAVYLMGGVFGLLAMVLTLYGMEKTQISYSTVVILIGQLGAGFLIDAIAAGKISPLKILGITLVTAGVFIDNSITSKCAAISKSECAVP